MAALSSTTRSGGPSKSACGRQREVDRVVCEGADLHVQPRRVRRAVQSRGGRVDRVVDVDREVEKAARHEHARQLAHDARRVLSVVDDVVAEHHVE
jgi:hypothetical protein